jgi:hypothetical protein
LAVVVKKLEGRGLIRFKPPPSNRIWISFETMPDIDMTIEPIVSSRQITYSIILRAIESRIREVIAETVVLPHWDDCSFTDTTHQLLEAVFGQMIGQTRPLLARTQLPWKLKRRTTSNRPKSKLRALKDEEVKR